MREAWKLPSQTTTPLGWRFDHVLVAYDGEPEIAFANLDGRAVFAVASDDDDHTVRYVAAAVSATERQAVLARATPLRAVLAKPEMFVVDVGRAQLEPLRMWTIRSEDLGLDDLPAFGALLPKGASVAASLAAGSVVKLDGPAVRNCQIGFHQSAMVMDAKQRLFNAIAQKLCSEPTQRGTLDAELLRRATLNLAGATPGSVQLQVVPSDEGLFTRVADEYSRIVAVSEDVQQLSTVLAGLGARCRSAYTNFVEQLARHEVEVLTTWSHGSAFLGHHAAARYRKILAGVEPLAEETIKAAGYFNLYNSATGNFEFRDESDLTYQGYVAPKVQADHPALLVGPTAGYVVAIAVYKMNAIGAGEISSCVLSAIVEEPGTKVADDRDAGH